MEPSRLPLDAGGISCGADGPGQTDRPLTVPVLQAFYLEHLFAALGRQEKSSHETHGSSNGCKSGDCRDHRWNAFKRLGRLNVIAHLAQAP